MGDLLLLAPAFAAVLLLIWAVRVQFVLRQMQRDRGYAPRRRRGRNPSLPVRKPAPPDWRRSFTHECTNPPTGKPPLKLRQREPAPPTGPPEQPLGARLIRYWAWEQEQVRRAWLGLPAEEPHPEDRQPAPPADPPVYGWGPRQLEPPPPAPGMRREYIWSPTQMAECNGPCWDTQDPRCCDCGALWRDLPIRMDEGQVQRGNCSGGPTTPKPLINPTPTGGRLIKAWEEPLPPSKP